MASRRRDTLAKHGTGKHDLFKLAGNCWLKRRNWEVEKK
jgi:hypothetical protein